MSLIVTSVNCDSSETNSTKDLLAARHVTVPSNLSIAHSSEGGLHIVRGVGAYLYDDAGRGYIDCVNNVSHVGHSNEYVNQKMFEQQQRVNTNTRYLSTGLSAYTRRLLSLMPTPLSNGKCFMVCSGSEANDLAMRLCRAHSHARWIGAQRLQLSAGTDLPMRPSTQLDIFICLAYGYHGATSSVIEISPYKYRAKGGRGRAPHVIEVDVQAEGFNEGMQQKELEKLQRSITDALKAGHSIAGFFHESVLSCAGQVFLPPAFIQRIYSIIRAAGGLCVADEVQTGFGRLGTWWAFQTLGVQPDVVTMGKSIGNGYPMAAVACTKQVAESFNNGMEYFNSCAGTNTATAVGLSVIDYIDHHNFIDHAASVGEFFLHRLRALTKEFPILSGVRGQGLFIGIDIETEGDHAQPRQRRLSNEKADASSPCASLTRFPNHPAQLPRCTSFGGTSRPCPLSSGDVCNWICAAMIHCSPIGILVGTDGPRHNVIKIKPPMVFAERDAVYVVDGLRAALIMLQRLHPCLAPILDTQLETPCERPMLLQSKL